MIARAVLAPGEAVLDLGTRTGAVAQLAAALAAERQQEAKNAVLTAMYPHGDGSRRFRNLTQFIVGRTLTAKSAGR